MPTALKQLASTQAGHSKQAAKVTISSKRARDVLCALADEVEQQRVSAQVQRVAGLGNRLRNLTRRLHTHARTHIRYRQ